MKTLKFASDLVPLILSGEKTSTWRLFDDKNLSVGDELGFVNRDTGQAFGSAVITDIREKKLGDITEQDFDGHEKFPDKNAIIETYKGYYGDKAESDTLVKIIAFSFKVR